MARMIRKQVYIEDRQDRLLKERAKRYRVTEAELIRQAIDQALTRRAPGTSDPVAWRAFTKRLRAYLKRHPVTHIEPWKREDLYDV